MHKLSTIQLIQQLSALQIEAPRLKDAIATHDALVARVASEAGRHYPERYGADGSRWHAIATGEPMWFERGYVAGLMRHEAPAGACAAYETGYAIGVTRADDPFPPSGAEVNPRFNAEQVSRLKLRYVTVPQCYGFGSQKFRLPAGARVADVGPDAIDPARRRVIWGGVLWIVNEPERNLCATPDQLVTLGPSAPEAIVRRALQSSRVLQGDTLATLRSRVWQVVRESLDGADVAWSDRFASAPQCDIDAWCRAGETTCIWMDRETHPGLVAQLIRLRYEALTCG
jgi:hypothetical protein